MAKWAEDRHPKDSPLRKIPGYYRRIPKEEFSFDDLVVFEYDSDNAIGWTTSGFLVLFESTRDGKTHQGIGILEPFRTLLFQPTDEEPETLAVAEEPPVQKTKLRTVGSFVKDAVRKAFRKVTQVFTR